MSAITDFIEKHAEQIEKPETGSINMEFFHVRIINKPDVKTFVTLTNQHRGEFGASNPLDGTEQNYIKLGGWVGDQGLAMLYMAIGIHLQLFKLLSPTSMMPQLPEETRKAMAGQGMVAVQATAMGKALAPKTAITQRTKVVTPKPDPYVGQKIKSIRPASPNECTKFGLDHSRSSPLVVIELENGELICPSRDAEGNGNGVFFTLSPNGEGGRMVFR